MFAMKIVPRIKLNNKYGSLFPHRFFFFQQNISIFGKCDTHWWLHTGYINAHSSHFSPHNLINFGSVCVIIKWAIEHASIWSNSLQPKLSTRPAGWQNARMHKIPIYEFHKRNKNWAKIKPFKLHFKENVSLLDQQANSPLTYWILICFYFLFSFSTKMVNFLKNRLRKLFGIKSNTQNSIWMEIALK